MRFCSLFSLPLICTLVAASISHFLTAVIKFSFFYSNKIGLLCSFFFFFFYLSLYLFICYPRQFRARLHGGEWLQVGEVTRLVGVTRLSVKSLIWSPHKVYVALVTWVTAEDPIPSKLYPWKSWIRGYAVIPFIRFSFTFSGFKNVK